MVALVAILITFIVPVTSSVVMGSKLTSGANQVVGALHLGRQAAIARNHTIEVRFYKYADSESPGEVVGDSATWKFRGFQFFEYLDSGAPVPFGKFEQLPSGIIFDGGDISTLLVTAREKKFSPQDPQIELPVLKTNYQSFAFRFLPSGATDLGLPARDWYITLHKEVDGTTRAEPPPDYATVQVDSISGSVKVYRPGL